MIVRTTKQIREQNLSEGNFFQDNEEWICLSDLKKEIENRKGRDSINPELIDVNKLLELLNNIYSSQSKCVCGKIHTRILHDKNGIPICQNCRGVIRG